MNIDNLGCRVGYLRVILQLMRCRTTYIDIDRMTEVLGTVDTANIDR